MNTFKIDHKAPVLQKLRMHHTWVGALLALAVIAFSQPVGPEDIEIFELAGHLLLIAALLGRMLSSLYIGGHKNAFVVDQGPFSVVRNPLYVSTFAAVAGVGLSTGMLTITFILIGAFILYYPHVVRREEALLEAEFGDVYRDYCSRVRRWIPRFGQWHSPKMIEIYPRRVLITLRDAIWLPLFIPLIELLEYLHETGLLPTVFKFY